MTDKLVKRKIAIRFEPDSIPAMLRAFRSRRGMDQAFLAEQLGVKQNTVSDWENGRYDPSPMALMAIGDLDKPNLEWWYGRAGPKFAERLKARLLYQEGQAARKKSDDRLVWVPLLHDPVGAGLMRNISEDDVDRELAFARDLMPAGAKPVAFRVSGDSMTPIVNEGYVVVIDAAQHDPRKLLGRMIAAREGDGITIKWLRKDKDFYLLVPQHVSPRIPVRVMRPEDDCGIVGVVLKWIGYPAPVRK